MEDQNIQTGQEAHYQLYDQVWSIRHEDWNRWPIYHILIKEECLDRHYQDDTGILTDGSTRNTQRVKDSNYLSWTGIWIHRKLTRL